MTMAYSPSHTQWAPVPHGIDQNGYPIPPPPNAPFMGDMSMDSKNTSRQRRTSSPGKRALQWFTRSRSASPAAVFPVQQDVADRSLDPPSPSSFVVRSVVKQPGGVSHEYDAYGNVVKPSSFDSQPYQKSKSQPLHQQPLQHSLIVPPGGPGGGTGYGTAKSTNDGRPEVEEPAVERGRSRSKSPNRPPSPGATRAGAFRPNTGRISPGPWSGMQVAQIEEQARMDRHEAMRQSRKNSYKDATQAAVNVAPNGPRQGPATSPLPRQSSPLAIETQQSGQRFSMPVHIPKGSAPPPVIPLNGVPSPVKVGFSPNQVAAAHSPFGSVSPAGSPRFFDESNSMQQQQTFDGSQGGSPSPAARWIKGLFGKSPRTEARDDGMYDQSNEESHWMRNAPSRFVQQNPNAWSDGTPLAGQKNKSAMHDAVEAEAAARKKHSMLMAARIEDEHRERVMQGHVDRNNVAHVDRNNVAQPWTAETPLSPPQSKSPPGRKPAPRFTVADLAGMTQKERELVAQQVDPDDRLSKAEGNLTPAQQIIAETRSKMIAASNQAGSRLSSSPPTNVQRGFVPSNAQDRPVQRPKQQQVQGIVSESKVNAAAKGLAAGTGPMPLDMPLGEAMQEMMIRFYKFERYAVPLMRSLETRLIDVERDNQMALNADGMSANSAREREMDKWVGQMTGLMQHEVSQLQLATREIRQAREILAATATSVSQVAFAKKTELDASTNKSKQASDHSERGVVAELPGKPTTNVEARRHTNISSSTFDSAIQKPVAQQAKQTASTTNNASPNGRVRYTSALGKPMQQGRISPLPIVSPVQATAPSPSPSSQSNVSSRRAMSVDDRLKALMSEKSRTPSLSASTNGRATSHGSRSSNTSSGGDSSINTSFEKLSLPTTLESENKIGDDYQLVTLHDVAPVAHAKTLSTLSTQTTTTLTTITPSTAAAEESIVELKPAKSMTLPPPPAPLSPNVTGNSLRLATAISTPTRSRTSDGPISLAASCSSSAIKTASHASNGLRARAQSYLQNAESSTPTTATSPLPSPGSLFATVANASPSASRLTTSASSNVLRTRDINHVDLTPAPAMGSARSASAEEIVIRPLSVKKSSSSVQKKVDVASNNKATAIKTPLVVKSLPTSNAASPARMSIKDRVAFFDAAQQRA